MKTKSAWGYVLVMVLMIGLFLIPNVKAGENGDMLISGLKSCSDPSVNLRTVPVNFKCQTIRGAIYERVSAEDIFDKTVGKAWGEAWKGPDGLVWSDFIGNSNHYDAINTCINLRGRLPEHSDFAIADREYGFREVLPNIAGKYMYWSSTLNRYSSDGAHYFIGDIGYIGGTARNEIRSVRCVTRR